MPAWGSPRGRGSGAVVCSLFLLIRWAQRAPCQAETPLIVLFRFLRPALISLSPAGSSHGTAHIKTKRLDSASRVKTNCAARVCEVAHTAVMNSLVIET